MDRQQERYLFHPTKIIAMVKNYRAHAAEMGGSVPSKPLFFLKPSSALLLDSGTVFLPKASRRVEHEVELAVIIGRPGSDIPPEKAWEHILGYSVTVDVTARDLQSEARHDGMPWTIAKGFDTFAPVGPCLIPTGELDPTQLRIWLAVNGQLRQEGNTRDMVYSIPEQIAAISSVMTLEAGDIIATGTPEGVGPLLDGDSVEAGIEGIGVLRFYCANR